MDASDEASIGRVLHAQWLDGDIEAFNQIFERYYKRIASHIEYHARQLPSWSWSANLVDEAVSDALDEYYRQPERFDANQSALLTYLRNNAYRDFLNERDKEFRHAVRNRDVPVGNDENDRNEITDTGIPVEDLVEQNAGDEQVEALLREICQTKDELIIARQIIDKERDANRCIVELGWPLGEESIKRLYREKDKLMKRIRRSLPKQLGEQTA
jgi:hypothetical protein